MGKLLRVLVVILLLLSIGALALGILLFNKRELLKARAQKLETAIIGLALTIERDAAVMEQKPSYPARDISVPAADDSFPEFSAFWEDYKPELELADQPRIDDLEDKKSELMTLWLKDAQGIKKQTGPGTMQDVLDNLLTKAEEQYNRLNDTRAQLKAVRAELVATVQDVNQQKGDLRQKLKKIVALEAEVARLETELDNAKARIAELEDENERQKDEIAQQKTDIAKLQESCLAKDDRIRVLEEQLEEMMRKDPDDVVEKLKVSPGKKGSISFVNPEWNFVVVDLDPAFLAELLGDDPDKASSERNIELMVKRRDTNAFVTKIRLTQFRKGEKVGIADIMGNWQQMPVQPGDIVFH